MIRLTVHKALKRKDWTPYQLAKATGMTVAMAYRWAKPGYAPKRLDLATLAKVAKALDMPPLKLLEYKPD